MSGMILGSLRGAVAMLIFGAVGAVAQGSGPVIDLVQDTIVCPPIQIGEEEILPFDSVLTNSGDSELIISSITVVAGNPEEFYISPATTFPLTVDPGESIGLTIHFRPDANGARSATLRIESNANNAPSIDLELVGTGATRSISGKEIDFGHVPAGETRDTIVRGIVWNSGPIPIRIDEITIQSQAFLFPDPEPLPVTLDIGDSFDLHIRYAPVIVGQEYVDSIEIESDAVPSPLYLRISANSTNSVEESEVARGGVRLLGAPFSGEVTGSLELERGTDATLTILDSRGLEVHRRDLGRLAPGEHRFSWSGEETDGRTAPSGVYYLHIITDHHTYTRKFILLR